MRKKIFVIFAISIVVLFLFSVVLILFAFPKKYKNHVIVFSEEFGLDKALVYAVIKVESDFNKDAVSKSDALGLMQILPKTAMWIAKELGEKYSRENMFDPKTNIKFGCYYLRYLFDKFGETDIVVCAYNAGEGKVLDWVENGKLNREKIDYHETKIYLDRVEKYYGVYSNKLVNV